MIKAGMIISDRYEIVELVGIGGMAEVYKAMDRRLNRFVAIKFLKPEFASDKDFVSRFRVEAQAAAILSHPNIVTVYDVGEDDDLHYIVMELVEGITLKKFIERKDRLEIKEAVGIAIQIAQGLECAHKNKIIHRDVKPQNIIISRDGKVKVTDFGIARVSSIANGTLAQQIALGSVHYLSPEQARGGYSDEKSDIYSLGENLYHMISGQVPFDASDSISIALMQIQNKETPLHELRPDVPVSVEKIVEKCMQKKPERRYLSATDLISDLRRSLKEPDGDFVRMTSNVVPDSPTIRMTKEDLDAIKNGAKSVPVDDIDIKNQNESDDDTESDVETKDKNPHAKQAKKAKSNKIGKEDEEDLDSMDPKFEKFIIIGTIVITVALGLALIFLIVKLTGFFGLFNNGNDNGVTPTPAIEVTEAGNGETTLATDLSGLVKVPAVVGLSKDDAEKTLKAVSANFTILWEEDYSAEVEKDYVISQYPPSSTDVAKNSQITLTISVGAETLAVPDISKQTLDEAKETLSAAGFETTTVTYEANADFEAGIVLSTNPAAGEMLATDQNIEIVVSSGPDNTTVAMPKLIGKTQDKAEEILSDAGLGIGDVDYANSDKYSEGKVCAQNYAEGDKVVIGTKVDITLSLGPADVEPTGKPDTADDTPTPTSEPSDENVEYNYVGSVSVDWELGDSDTATFYAEITQGGNTQVLFDGGDTVYDKTSFPYTLNISEDESSGFTEGNATVTVYFNDAQADTKYSVSLTAKKK
jgi:serine/threonine protein kinase/beta-lactam-binding protein with PASTA domain